MTAKLNGIDAGSTKWATGSPPHIRGLWETGIIELAERGDSRFIAILREHVKRGTIRSERALAALHRTDANEITA